MTMRNILTTVVAGAIVLLLVASFSVWRLRRESYYNHCVSNMAQFNAAKEQYALQHQLAPGTVVTRQQIGEFIKGGWQHFDCISAGGDSYIIGVIGEEPRCPVHGTLYNMHLPRGWRP